MSVEEARALGFAEGTFTLGQFRRLTVGLPDSTEVRVACQASNPHHLKVDQLAMIPEYKGIPFSYFDPEEVTGQILDNAAPVLWIATTPVRRDVPPRAIWYSTFAL